MSDEDTARSEALAASQALPPEKRIALAHDVLGRAKRLRDEVREDLRLKRFGADDVQMEMYNELVNGAAWLFPDDPVLCGKLVLMPDAILKSFGTFIPIESMANYLPARRLETRLSRLIDRLEMVLGKPATDALPARPAAEVLAEAQTPETREIRQALAALLRTQPELPPIDVRDFSFIDDPRLRAVLVTDYVEGQRAFASGAFKAAAILAGGVIEGMLLDYLQRPSIAGNPTYARATEDFPRTDGDINWNRVSLTNLIRAASDLGILGTARRLVEGARDFRDTVHPTAEVRLGGRAGREEAELLLALVRLIYRDLSSGESQ